MKWIHTHWMIDFILSEDDEDRFPVMIDARGLVTTAPAWEGGSPIEHRDACIFKGWSFQKVTGTPLTYAEALRVS